MKSERLISKSNPDYSLTLKTEYTAESMHINYKIFPEIGNQPFIQVGIVSSREEPKVSPGVLVSLDSFNGVVGWKSIPDSSSLSECDVSFDEPDLKLIRICFPADGANHALHCLSVTVLTTQAHPALSSIIHAVLGPAFAPGIVCIDWNDVKDVLSCGKQGLLALVSGEPVDAIAEAHTLVSSQLNLLNSESIKSALAVLFVPEGQPCLAQISQSHKLLGAMMTSEQSVLISSAPVITDGKPMFALLVVTDSSSSET